ncbi:MAG TPA: S9 family peptidase [Blastocatellia bacterium]|nr:S9 family peptidase [Blastocatellia bacterium]HMX24834.1 S9 family peptidase [Blastocatellia bacterium]HMY71017.1 S9 family peptidase [Blastocatellia bacterium]HNG32970.1 S9 family peptidase [Blastocatellia bacterium]
MNNKKTAFYGSWRSPITSDLIVAGTIGLGQAALEGNDVYWIESRPQERGRNVIVRRSAGGEINDVTPLPFNARTRVHEYGGGSYIVNGGEVFFSNFADQRIYHQWADRQPRPITPEAEWRYADAVYDGNFQRLICVREDHSVAGHEAVNAIVGIPLFGPLSVEIGEQQVLAGGYDFYSSPRLNRDCSQLAWLSWNHPNMPWDGTELWVADVQADGSLANQRLIAGGAEESIFQPEWSPQGELHFISDRTGWWNLYRLRNGKAEALCPMEADFGLPQWVFGMSTYVFREDETNSIACTYIEQGFSRLALLNTTTGTLEKIETPYTRIEGIRTESDRAVFVAASPTEATSIVSFDLTQRTFETLRRSSELTIDPGYLSLPQPIEFPTENNLTAHGFFYAPCNRDFSAPEAEKPPLLVMIHGGPTAATSPTLRLGIQYWTSRGIAVLDVNYGGSTGYGRDYRQRLNGNWGIVDVDDCVNGARYLAEQGLVDGNRLAITGGSAGGYTVLCALTFRDVFKAGASHYGVSDLIALDEDTHKFESRYTFGLVGTSHDLYRARSPIHHTDKLNAPVIFFQGLEDKIVPPNQAEMMVEALRKKKLPVAYVAFEGEQHGFRQAANIKRALDGELYFYSRIFGFELAEAVEPVPIENL